METWWIGSANSQHCLSIAQTTLIKSALLEIAANLNTDSSPGQQQQMLQTWWQVA